MPFPTHLLTHRLLTPMTTLNDIQTDQSPCSLTDDDLQDITGGIVLTPGTKLPEIDPSQPFPWWIPQL